MVDETENTQSLNVTQPTHTTSGVATVDGQKYAVGLMWQPVQNLDDPIPEIRETTDDNADLVGASESESL